MKIPVDGNRRRDFREGVPEAVQAIGRASDIMPAKTRLVAMPVRSDTRENGELPCRPTIYGLPPLRPGTTCRCSPETRSSKTFPKGRGTK